MVRPPCCDDNGVKKGPWTAEEDEKLVEYIKRHGHGSWRALPQHAGLNRCGKSCRLRWANYLNPDIKRGKFSEDEERTIINLHAVLGNKWSRIAAHLPGRTDNEIKNFWNTHLRKKLLQMGLDPITHKPRTDLNQLMNLSHLLSSSNIGNLMNPLNNNNPLKLQADTTQLAKFQLLQTLMQFINNGSLPNVNNFTPFEGLVNGSNTLYNKGQQTQEFEEFLNPNSYNVNLWGSFEGGLINGENPSFNNGCYPLPALVSDSNLQSDNAIQMESKTNPNDFSTCSPNSTIFEAWEKLMDDETSSSYWKNILELTSS